MQNFAKCQKFQLDNLVDLEKCCKTHIFLQKSVPIQPKTSNMLPKFCRSAVVSVDHGRAGPVTGGGPGCAVRPTRSTSLVLKYRKTSLPQPVVLSFPSNDQNQIKRPLALPFSPFVCLPPAHSPDRRRQEPESKLQSVSNSFIPYKPCKI